LYSVSLSHVLHPVPQQGGILKRISTETGAWSVAAPSEVATELNRRFPLMERSGHYVTFLYGILELANLRFRYVRAGHPGPLWISGPDAHVCDEGGDIPIGVMEDAEYHDIEVQLAHGDVLLLLTDGVLETRCPQGDNFGVARVLEVAQLAAAGGARHTIDALHYSLEAFRKHEPQRDDVTVLALRAD
jgi:serine phosphatase RsbU (regulator of sigma subunit)